VRKHRRLCCSPSKYIEIRVVRWQPGCKTSTCITWWRLRQHPGRTQDSLAVLLSRSPCQNVQTNRCTTGGPNHRYLRYHPILEKSDHHSLAHDQQQRPISALQGEKKGNMCMNMTPTSTPGNCSDTCLSPSSEAKIQSNLTLFTGERLESAHTSRKGIRTGNPPVRDHVQRSYCGSASSDQGIQ
jgi:hypothetical protein